MFKNPKRKMLPIIHQSLLLWLIGTGVALSQTATELVEKYAAQMHSLQSQFVQTVHDAQGALIQKQTGVLKIKKPNKFYLHYQTPKSAEQFIISNGSKMWAYAVDLEEASVSSVDESLQNAPVSLLLKGASLSSQYKIIDRGSVDNQHIVELSPNQADDYGMVLLVFSPKGALVKMRLEDKLGNRTALDFSHTQTNPKLADSVFEFVAPKGVFVSGGQ